MGRRLQDIKDRFGIPSSGVILHIVAVEAVLQVLWWVVGKVFTMIPDVVKGWGFLAVFIAAIFAVAWYLPKISPRLHGASTTKKANGTLQPMPISEAQSLDYDRKYADWMTAALNRDMNNFPRCISIHNLRVDWAGLAAHDSHFLIYCDVYSSSVFTVDIGMMVDGHLRYKSQRTDGELEKVPEITNPLVGLERSVNWQLVIRQWVSQSMMNAIALDGGNEVTLVFSSVNIRVSARYPDGSDGPRTNLPLPHEYKVRLATRSEIESQPKTDRADSQP